MRRNGLPTSIDRRIFLKSALGVAGAAVLGGSALKGAHVLFNPNRRSFGKFPGGIQGASYKVGHLLRDAIKSEPEEILTTGVAILGGGMSGLSSAWWLNRSGFEDFTLFELEPETGGNSRGGRNEVSGYPWGAHYVPIPGPEARWVRMLFEELGVIEGYDARGLPVFNPFYLCSDPQERLFDQGKWREGLVPQVGLSAQDKEDLHQFFEEMGRLKSARGRDGRPAFSIPVETSSNDSSFRDWDKMSMATFLAQRGWKSKPLHWYVNYCCRDDFGATYDQVSAWAGIHYFASRAAHASNADSSAVLTWPEGNGWIAHRLKERVSTRIRENSLVTSVKNVEGEVWVDVFDVVGKKKRRWKAKAAIFAAPRFVAAHIVPEMNGAPEFKNLSYAPWMTANLTLRELPRGEGVPLSWDNVSIYSESLGYIVATHQLMARYPKETVITYYLPLTHVDPQTARKEALARTHEEWTDRIVADLEKANRGIRQSISRIDVWLWGHGMIRPDVGFIWGDTRRKMARPLGKIHFAHSDMSGMSMFEEAQYQGVTAAQSVLREIS